MSDKFVDWLSVASSELDIDLRYLLATDHPALGWFRGVFHNLGPVSAPRLRLLVEEAVERSAGAALELMRREADFYRKRMPDAGIEERESTAVPGRRGFYFLGRELDSWTIELAILAIGDMVQEEIMEDGREAWPVCELHGFGLHLKMVQEEIVWWCGPGNHPDRVIYSPSS